MKRKIYFCGSIRGGREDAALYEKAIRLIQETDVVLTEHIGNVAYSAVPRSQAGDREIYAQDTDWLRESDLVIAFILIQPLCTQTDDSISTLLQVFISGFIRVYYCIRHTGSPCFISIIRIYRRSFRL